MNRTVFKLRYRNRERHIHFTVIQNIKNWLLFSN
ncbi:hypothetical protein MED222_06295 [Vibrio sp. MED222]|nr:hypothetical protein MED222_06295 [Vibrio sp. MED222]